MIVRQLRSRQSLFLLAPSALLGETDTQTTNATCSIAFEKFRASIEASIAYQALEEHKYVRMHGVPIPFYRKTARFIRRRFFGDNVFEHALLKVLKRESVELVHIPTQQVAFRSVVSRFPYVINPHDFQHEYFPEFFAADVLEYRRTVWRADQQNASAIVVHSRQTERDAIKYLSVSEDRVFYAPYGPLDSFPEPEESELINVKKQFVLPDRFMFYPAHSWPHKNHIALLDAIHLLKRKGVEVQVVFTAIIGDHGAAINEKIGELGLVDQVKVVGRVPPLTMGALYRLCTMVVVPSLFEQNSGPMLEAIHFGKPIAASQLEELVSTLNGAGELFDPYSVSEIAGVIDKLWSSNQTLSEAEANIKKLRAEMSWKPFREAYSQAYNYALEHPVKRNSHSRRNA